ncbi:MAG: GDP-mannose 4,6-dehydratase, partial [Sphaerospermopsis kisseleviana]
MKLLITGGYGFVGSNLASSALNKQDQVFIIDNLLKIGSQENKNWLESQADKHQLTIGTFDISNADAVNGFFEKYAPFDGIAHLAG